MNHPTWKTATKLLICCALVAASGSTFAGHHGTSHKVASQKDIVDTAVGAGTFETLVAAVQAAGLVDALKGDGPFTVFAPTDEAFAKLPAGTVETLLEPDNIGRLKDILTYHVVSGKVSARKAAGLDSAATLNGREVGIAIRDGVLRIDDASVVANDIDCANGVIHVIDRVLLPEETRVSAMTPGDLIELAISRGAPLYNHGQTEACAAIYEVAAQGLLAGFADELAEPSRARLRTALRDMRSTHDSRDRAWTLRRALDDVYGSLDHDSSADMMGTR